MYLPDVSLNYQNHGQIIGLSIVGFGIGTTMTIASHFIMSNARAEKAGMAASIEEVVFELGGATGIAIVGSLTGLMYRLYMNVPQNVQAPNSVKDSIDEAKIFAETLLSEHQKL